MDAMKAQLREKYSTWETEELIELRARDTLTHTAYEVLDEILQERGVEASAVTKVREAPELEVRQNAVASVPKIEGVWKGMGDFRKTVIMNIVLASAYAITGVVSLVKIMRQEPWLGFFAIIPVLVVAFLVLVPAANAYALSRAGGSTLRRRMLRANWILIGFVVFCSVVGVVGVALERMPDRWVAVLSIELGALIAVIPWWVTTRALRSALGSKKSAHAPQAESAEPGGPISSAGH